MAGSALTIVDPGLEQGASAKISGVRLQLACLTLNVGATHRKQRANTEKVLAQSKVEPATFAGDRSR